MSEKFKIAESGCPHFVTFTVVHWIDLFTRNEYRNVIIESLKFCQQKKRLEIFAWCLMTNHLHMIIGSNSGSNLQNIIRDFRGFTSKKLKSEIQSNPAESRKKWMLKLFHYEGSKRKTNGNFQLWKRNYHPIELFNRNIFEEKLNYIHQNPVKAGLVFEPQEYVYSSAVNYAGRQGLLDVMIECP